MKKEDTKGTNVIARNKRASFDFELIERFTAGLQLTGTEIKSIRAGKASIKEAYCYLHEGEAWIKNMHIAEYEQAGWFNHEARRERKLLLTKGELRKLGKQVRTKGFTIVPTRLFITPRGWAKLEIALARAKKQHDKREAIKQKDMKREMERGKKFPND